MSEDSHTSEEIVSEEEKQPPKKRTKKIAKTKKKDDTPKEKETKEKDTESKEESNDEVPEKKPKKTRGPKKSKLDHPRTIDMILEAIENLEDSRGSSVQSIKSYIMTNFKVRDDMIKSMMRRALAIAVKDNVLIRPKNQVQKSQLLSGRYLIRPKSKEEIEPPKPRPSKLRQLGVLKPKKGKKSKGKKRKRKGFY